MRVGGEGRSERATGRKRELEKEGRMEGVDGEMSPSAHQSLYLLSSGFGVLGLA